MKNQQPTSNQQEQNIFDICEPKDTKRALQFGFNLTKLNSFISSICANFTDQEKPNSIDINSDYIWLYVHNPKTGNYKDMQTKYNNCKGWAIPNGLKEKNNKKILSNLLELATMGADFKKSNKPKNGYFIKEIANNKPLTLLKAKDNNFVCFVVFAEFGKINEIDINEDKKEFDKNFFEISNNYWDAATIRKHAVNIYAVYNKQMTQYKKTCELIAKKRVARTQNRYTTPKELKKYFYTDESFLHDLLRDNGLHLYNSFSHNSLKDHNFDECAPGLEIRLNERTLLKTTEPMTRQQVFNYCVDKSGFCVIFYREKMLRRLETLKIERAKAREEQERKEWIVRDKADLLKTVAPYWYYLKEQIEKRAADLNKILSDKDFNEFKKYRELLKDFNKLSDFSKYKSVSEWQKDFNSVVNDFDFFNRAIIKGVFEKISCRHHYEKQQDGSYKNISKDSYFTNPGRYIQVF